jgi:hypothetical protein
MAAAPTSGSGSPSAGRGANRSTAQQGAAETRRGAHGARGGVSALLARG